MITRTPSTADLDYSGGETPVDPAEKMRELMQPFVDASYAELDTVDVLDAVPEEIPAVPEIATDEAVEATPEIELSEDEKLAASEGWKPLDQFQGDPDKWVDAATFLDRKPFFAKIREQHESIKKLTADNAAIQELVQNLMQRDLQTAAQDLQAKKEDVLARQKTAFETGDYEGFLKTQKELLDLASTPAPVAVEANKPVAPPPANIPPPPAFYKEWEKENATWISVPAARAIGDAAAISIMNDPGFKGNADARLKAALAEARRVVAKVYPQYFSNPRKTAPAAVSAGRASAAPASATNKLSPGALRIASNMARSAGIPLNQFLANMAKGRK